MIRKNQKENQRVQRKSKHSIIFVWSSVVNIFRINDVIRYCLLSLNANKLLNKELLIKVNRLGHIYYEIASKMTIV